MLFKVRFPVVITSDTGSTRPFDNDVVISVSARNQRSALKKVGDILTEIAKPKRKKSRK
jgi:hypothetical protein